MYTFACCSQPLDESEVVWGRSHRIGVPMMNWGMDVCVVADLLVSSGEALDIKPFDFPFLLLQFSWFNFMSRFPSHFYS